MLPSLIGIIASSGGAVAAAGDYESIATANGTGSNTSITFSSIPTTYSHLQLRWFSKTNESAAYTFLYIRLNSDTGSNYATHELYGNGSSAGAAAGTTQTSGWLGYSGAANTTSNYGVGVTDILDYAKTNKYKTIRTLTGLDSNGAGSVGLESALWQSTSAVTGITIFASGSPSFTSGTTFALYGIKG